MDKKKGTLPTSWKIIILLVIGIIIGLLVSKIAHAKDVYVDGYQRQNGTYVAPHHRSSPDNSQFNNYGSQGNYNPYTGQQGTQQPYTNRGSSSICPYGQRC